jgi:hypothetical protein
VRKAVPPTNEHANERTHGNPAINEHARFERDRYHDPFPDEWPVVIGDTLDLSNPTATSRDHQPFLDVYSESTGHRTARLWLIRTGRFAYRLVGIDRDTGRTPAGPDGDLGLPPAAPERGESERPDGVPDSPGRDEPLPGPVGELRPAGLPGGGAVSDRDVHTYRYPNPSSGACAFCDRSDAHEHAVRIKLDPIGDSHAHIHTHHAADFLHADTHSHEHRHPHHAAYLGGDTDHHRT